MRRVFLAAMMGLGLLFGTMTVPSPVSRADAPKASADKSEVAKTVVTADNPIELPETTIVAPTQPVKRGRQVVFRVAPLKNAPKELLSYTHVWVISPDPGDEFILDDGSKGSFGSGDANDPDQYTLTVVSNFLFVDSKNAATLKSTKTTAIVKIADVVKPPGPPVPPPGPSPGPTPTPTPVPPAPTPGPLVIPDGTYKLGQFTYDLVKTLPKSDCEKLGKEFQRLAGLLAAGAATPSSGIRSKAELVRQSAEAFTAALGGNLKAWQPALDALATKMDSLKIMALPDCQQAYTEVATGLEANK